MRMSQKVWKRAFLPPPTRLLPVWPCIWPRFFSGVDATLHPALSVGLSAFCLLVGRSVRHTFFINCNLNVRYQQSELQNKRNVWLSSLKTVLILCQCYMLFLLPMARYGVIAHRKWKEIWNQHALGILQAVDVNSRRRSLAAVPFHMKLYHIFSF